MATILVVDDEPSVRTLIAQVLKRKGLSVLTADSGLQALSISRLYPGHIDVLISDVVMPGMDGPTLAKNLIAENPHLSVAFISGGCSSNQLENCRPFRLVLKPFRIADFLDIVWGLLSKADLKAP